MSEAGDSGAAVAATPRLRAIEFVLPFALESLNVRDRQAWFDRHKAQDRMKMEIIAAIGGTRYLPHPPFPRARITVVRCSAGRLDEENLSASLKGMVDCLCVVSRVHPHGLGIIIDDDMRRLERVVSQTDALRGAGATAVRVEELEPLPAVVAPVKPKRSRGPAALDGTLDDMLAGAGLGR